MTRRLQTYLSDLVERVRAESGGTVPANPPAPEPGWEKRCGVALVAVDGTTVTAGDADVEFAIQSSSKALVFALALADRGIEEVERVIGVEPSGLPFDAPSVDASGRPDNPMINAGAMTAHGLLLGPNAGEDERVAFILDAFSRMAGRTLRVDERVYEHELEHAHVNLSIAHMLRARDVLPDEPGEVVSGYLRQCAIAVTARDLATMAATLANRGRRPETGEQILEPPIAKHVLGVMMSCGMYDAAGDWITDVGLPAKSGVGGGILGVAPGRVGIGTFSPPLDEHGNSHRGELMFERLSADYGLHFVEALDPDEKRWGEALVGTD